MRLALLVAAIGLTGCATAGVDPAPPGGAIDAPPGIVIDAPPPIDAALATCTTPDTCAGAMMLGSVSGDSGNQKLTASGYRAAWYRVRVTENVDGVAGLSLRVAAKLTLAPAGGFDVFVYVNTASDTIECTTTRGTATTNGNVRQVRAEWGEGAVANGVDDSRTVSIEVRPLGATCPPDQGWQLEIEGNWN